MALTLEGGAELGTGVDAEENGGGRTLEGAAKISTFSDAARLPFGPSFNLNDLEHELVNDEKIYVGWHLHSNLNIRFIRDDFNKLNFDCR